MMISNIVIVNTETEERLELDNKTTPSYILEDCIIDPIDAVISAQDMVTLDGTNITNIRLGTRTATINGWIIGPDDFTISELRKKLNRMINPKQQVSVLFNGYKVTGSPTSTIVYGNTRSNLNEVMCMFYISLLCDNPYIQDEFSKRAILANWEKHFVFPLKFDIPENKMIFGLRSPSKIIRVTNGSSVACGLKVTFDASLNDVKYPRLTNITTQTYLELNLILAAYDRAVVDNTSKYLRATLRPENGESYSIVNDITDDSTLPVVIPVGTSMYTYSAEENVDGLQISLEFNPSYLEVL